MSFSYPSSSSSDYSSSSSSSSSSDPSLSYFSKLTSAFGSSDISSSKDFLESNTFIAKTAFLLLVIILFFYFFANWDRTSLLVTRPQSKHDTAQRNGRCNTSNCNYSRPNIHKFNAYYSFYKSI